MRPVRLFVIAILVLGITRPSLAQFEDAIQKALEAQLRNELSRKKSSGAGKRDGALDSGTSSDPGGKKDGAAPTGDDPSADGGDSGTADPPPDPTPADPWGPDEDDDPVGAPPAKTPTGGVIVWPLPKPPPRLVVGEFRYRRWVAGKQTDRMSDYEFEQWKNSVEYLFFVRDAEEERLARWQRFEEIRRENWERYDDHPVIDNLFGWLRKNDEDEAALAQNGTDEQFLAQREYYANQRRLLEREIELARSIAHDPRLTDAQRDTALEHFDTNRDYEAALAEAAARPFATDRGQSARSPEDYASIPDSEFLGKIYVVQDHIGPLAHGFVLIQDPMSPTGFLRVEVKGPGFGFSLSAAAAVTIGSSVLDFTFTDDTLDDLLDEDGELTPKYRWGDYRTLTVPPHIHRRLLQQAWAMYQESQDENWQYHVYVWTDRSKQCSTIVRDWFWRGGVYLPDNTVLGFDFPAWLPNAIDDYKNGYRSALPAGGWRNRAIKLFQAVIPGDSLILDDPLQYYDEVWDTRLNPVEDRKLPDRVIPSRPLPDWVQESLAIQNRPAEVANASPEETSTDTEDEDGFNLGVDWEIGRRIGNDPIDEIWERQPDPESPFDLDEWNRNWRELVDQMVRNSTRPAPEEEQSPTPQEPTDWDPILFDRERDADDDDPIPYDPVENAPDRPVLDLLDPNKYGLLVPWANGREQATSPVDVDDSDALSDYLRFETAEPEFAIRVRPSERFEDDDLIFDRVEDSAERARRWAQIRYQMNPMDQWVTDDFEPFAGLQSDLSVESFGGTKNEDCPITTDWDRLENKWPYHYTSGGKRISISIPSPQSTEATKTYRLDLLPTGPYVRNTRKTGGSAVDQWGLQRIGSLSRSSRQLVRPDRTTWNPCIVAVIDSGIDATHPDLRGQLWRNASEIPGNQIDDDRNGFIDDVHGFNFEDFNEDVSDVTGHGTHVAALIAGRWNGSGIVGVAPECRVMALRAFDQQGRADPIRVALAIRYAVYNGASIIHISARNPKPIEMERAIIEWAQQCGVLIIASSGSTGERVTGTSPGGLPGVLTVGAIDQADRRAGFSGWGPEIDLVAPGVDILSARATESNLVRALRSQASNYESNSQTDSGRVVDKHWYVVSGTSFSAPFVTGAAAQLWTRFPNYSAPQIRALILNGCDDLERPGWDMLTGVGCLNVSRSLRADPDLEVNVRIKSARRIVQAGLPVLEIRGTARSNQPMTQRVQLAFGDSPGTEDWRTVSEASESIHDDVLTRIPGRTLNRRGTWWIRCIVDLGPAGTRETRTKIEIR